MKRKKQVRQFRAWAVTHNGKIMRGSLGRLAVFPVKRNADLWREGTSWGLACLEIREAPKRRKAVRK